MKFFVDTAALLAVLDAADEHHPEVSAAWEKVLGGNSLLVTTNYVIVETLAVAQRKLGLEAVRAIQQEIVPAMHVIFVDENAHERAVSALLTSARRRLSLVDCCSFDAMRQNGITRVLGTDRHFAEQGFELAP